MKELSDKREPLVQVIAPLNGEVILLHINEFIVTHDDTR
jgi:hypothetical protein